jgi:Pyruvate/2-oxoacid:ferredoxin oxidoreductase delta subunit
MVLRKLVRIDEEKCNGCGSCIIACAEGALKIVDGKAKLISDVYCDGLGACLGECPEDAISVEDVEAEEFDEEAVKKHLKTSQSAAIQSSHQISHSCPSSNVTQFERKPVMEEHGSTPEKRESMLINWPVQLMLLPPNAPFLENADLLITADCVPFAYANFHNDFIKGKPLVIGCPKLDDAKYYTEKLTKILKQSNIRSLTVVNMEVPCCHGLYHLVNEALRSSGKTIPITQQIISVKGAKITKHNLT